MSSSNPQSPFFGPGFPNYPIHMQVVRITGAAVPDTNPAIYPGVVEQWVASLPGFRDRETCFVTEVNDDRPINRRHLARLVSAFGGQPLYAVEQRGGEGSQIRQTVYTADDIWTKPANLILLEVQALGGGGGGGGAPSGSATTASAGGGGGAGGYAYKMIAAGALAAMETVTVGEGGAGSLANGMAGTTSAFGSHLSAAGGVGGQPGMEVGPGSGLNVYVTGRAFSGTGSGGDINGRGGAATVGLAIYDPVGVNIWLMPGVGGSTLYGGGGTANAGAAAASTSANSGVGFGAGGSGGSSGLNLSQIGGHGADGAVIVKEYIGSVPAGSGFTGTVP